MVGKGSAVGRHPRERVEFEFLFMGYAPRSDPYLTRPPWIRAERRWAHDFE